MPRGGRRPGAGRKRTRLENSGAPAAVLDGEFASRVFERIKEGPPRRIRTAEDFQLDLLFSKDLQTRSYNFNRLLDRKYGKPFQRREDTVIFDPNAPLRVEIEHIGRSKN